MRKKDLSTKIIISTFSVGYLLYSLTGNHCIAAESKQYIYENQTIIKEIIGAKDEDAFDSFISLNNSKTTEKITGGQVNKNGYFLISNNKIEITNGSEVNNVLGGVGSTSCSIRDNHISIKDSTINGQIAGGFANATSGTVWFSTKEQASIENNTINISNSKINTTSDPSGGNIIGGFSQGSPKIDIQNNSITLSGTIDITAKSTYYIYGASSIKGTNLKENSVIINSDATITANQRLIISGGNNTSGTQENDLNGTVENNYVKIDGIINSNADIYAGYSKSTTETVKGNYIEIGGNASIINSNLYGSNKSNNGSNNNLIINQWGGTAKSAQYFDNLIFTNLSFNNEQYNGIDKAIFSTTNTSSLNDTNIIIQSFSDDTDLAVSNTRYVIVDGKNISFDKNNVSSSETVNNKLETDMINDDKNENSNGIRIHNIKIYTDDANKDNKNDVSLGVKKSILSGKYTAADGTDHYNSQDVDNSGKLYLDATVSTNASVITGAYASGSSNATGGTLIIDGSYTATNAGNNLYAGYSESGAVNNNNIFLNSAAIGTINLYAYNADAKSYSGNNSVTITGKDNAVNSLNGFDTLNFDKITWENAGTVLTINNSGGKQESLANANVYLNSFNNASAIKVNDSMLLIKGENLRVDLKNNVHDNNFAAGVAAIGKGQAELVPEGLRYTITKMEVNPQVNLIAENRSVAAAFVNQGSDLIADGLNSLADQYGYGLKTFAAVYGNRSSYDVNSDLKINGWSDIVGFGETHRTASGVYDWGIFYENGVGNYRTENNFNDEFFRGYGNLLYNGGGVAAKLWQDGGLYYEGSLRVGTLKSEMSNAVKDGAGNLYDYESDSTYYGAHLGVGKIFAVGGNKELDVYGKFFHTYVDGDSFVIAGDKFEFDSVTSDRLRVGARLATNKNNKWSAAYGLAYEYEFNGDSDMRAAQFSLPQQSLKGGTVIGEIGLSYPQTKDNPWRFDLKLTGYQGQRDGFSGMAQVTYNF